jgi:hypothetical protein
MGCLAPSHMVVPGSGSLDRLSAGLSQVAAWRTRLRKRSGVSKKPMRPPGNHRSPGSLGTIAAARGAGCPGRRISTMSVAVGAFQYLNPTANASWR